MARKIKEHEYLGKRDAILDAAQRLVFTKGYEGMTIQDILAELQISGGAFYHYFPSKSAVLEALIERIQRGVEQPLLPIVEDPHLTAVEKLRKYFATLDAARDTQKAFIANLTRVWFSDDNAIVREKVASAIVERRGPLLTKILRQGVREGVFTTPYPDQAGVVILSLAYGMGDRLARLMLSVEDHPDDEASIDEIVATYDAFADAIERVLGVVSPFLDRPDANNIRQWLNPGSRSEAGPQTIITQRD